MSRFVRWVGAASLFVATSVAAQSSVEGVIRDSLAHRALAGATVQLVGGSGFSRTVTSDSSGRFVVDGVPAGRYTLGFFHPMLDSLGVDAPVRSVVADGRAPTHLDVATPSAAQILAAVCGAKRDTAGGVVIGVVRNAKDGASVAGATVTGDWVELTFTTKGVARNAPHLAATTSESGWFALCDVPRDGTVLLGARHGADTTAHVEQVVPTDGLLRRELYLGAGDGVPLRGVVVTAVGGQPLPGARVRVAGGTETVANERGEWSLAGAPLGTRMLEVRAVGYYPERRVLDVTPSMPLVRSALPTLRSVLDTVKVIASREKVQQVLGFEDRRRAGLGRYLTADDVTRKGPINTAELFRNMAGVRYEGHGIENSVEIRGPFGWCVPNYYIDGMWLPGLTADELNGWVTPPRIRGIEVYAGATVPPQFQPPLGGECGSIVIWTK